MTGFAITITDKGRAALVAASGTNAVTISAIGISAASVTPTATATTLPGEIKRLATFAGTVTDADTIHITIRDDSADSYALRAFALYLSDGTLFGLYGGSPQGQTTDTLIMEKSTGSMLMLAVDIQITGSDATNITFGDTDFLNPAATTEVQGVVELASEAETTTGTDAKRAVTPKGLMAAVTKWLDTRFGAGAPSTFIKGLLASASAAVVRTALEIKSAALQEAAYFVAAASYTAADVLAKLQTVDGAGSGMDADMLDGLHASSLVRSDALTTLSTLRIQPTGGSYNEGIRISPSSGSGYSIIILGADPAASYGTIAGQWNIGRSPDYKLFFDYNGAEMLTVTPTGVAAICGNTVWHTGNDGAGSGMDADTLDGIDGAAYARVVSSYNSASGGYRIWSDGFRECWGRSALSTNTYTTITYPVAFNSWSRALCSGGYASSSAQDNGPWVAEETTTNCKIYSSIDESISATWKAWGY